MMRPIKMVDLLGLYNNIKQDIDSAILKVLEGTDFIQGKAVTDFENELSVFLDSSHVISCGNGTDALQIAMMALDFKPGDEIIIPVHTYVATAETIALLNLTPVFVDVDESNFTIDIACIENKITSKTVAIVPVHLYGQCADMEAIMALAKKYNLFVIEDAAQSLGAEYIFKDHSRKKSGTIGDIGTTSFFPSKNLGAFGDGGAMITNDGPLAERIRMIANHGQRKKYHHELVGVNSRLDTLQAAILSVKLKRLSDYEMKRREVAAFYDHELSQIEPVKTPVRPPYSTHVYHQYTLQISNGKRDALKTYLAEKKIPTMIYYPVPLHFQPAYSMNSAGKGSFPVSEKLSNTVLSLPIHTEMDTEQLSYICGAIKNFF